MVLAVLFLLSATSVVYGCPVEGKFYRIAIHNGENLV